MTANPTLLSMPLAQNGQKNVIPETQATAGDGLFSQSTGFPAETSLPLGAGGVAPSREDFNGLANLLGGVAFYVQKGWIFQFDAAQDYYAGCVVRDTNDGNLYECINDVSAGGSNPAADSTNWKPFASGGGLYLRESSKAYAVGDIAYNENLPSYMHLLCTTGGTTSATEPDFTGAQIGGTISDGTVVWTYAAFADRNHSVVDSYYDSATGDWWRQYADGWIEQGGLIAGTFTNPKAITFNKPMADTNFACILSTSTTETSGRTWATETSGSRTTTGINIRRYEYSGGASNSDILTWVVIGQGVSA